MDGVLEEKDKKTMLVYTNSRSAVSLESPVYHGRSKHILTKWHFTRKQVAMGRIALEDMRTEKMGADMLTKVSGPNVIKVNMKLIGLSIG